MIPELALKPTDGEFDLAAIHRHLDSLDTAIRDPQNPDRFLLSSDPAALREAAEQRRGSNPVPYTVAVLHPTPTIIALTTFGSDTRPSRDFVEWLRKQQSLKILDQEFNDFTSQCEDDLDHVFGAPD